MGQRHGCCLNKTNIVLVFLSVKSSGEFMAQWLMGGRWWIRTNQELYQLCGENDIVKFCKLSRLRWAGHVICQDDDDLFRRVLLSEPGGKHPRLRREDGVKEDASKLGCRYWTVVTLNREGWKNSWRRPRSTPGCSAFGERERVCGSHTLPLTFFLCWIWSFCIFFL